MRPAVTDSKTHHVASERNSVDWHINGLTDNQKEHTRKTPNRPKYVGSFMHLKSLGKHGNSTNCIGLTGEMLEKN